MKIRCVNKLFLLFLILSCCILSGCAAVVIGVGAGIGGAVYVSSKLTEVYDENYHNTIDASKDVLDELKICTGYRYKGSLLESFPPEIQVLEQCKPEYQTVKGWTQKTDAIKNYEDLPVLARDYLNRLSDKLFH